MDKRQFQTRARFRNSLRRHKIKDGASLLVAVSGGRDSLVLLDLCRREARGRRWRLWVVHVDHGARPDSHLDAGWVRNYCRGWGIRSIGFRARTGLWSRHSPTEQNLRHLRYAAFRKAAARSDADFLLLGHHLNDQAETVLMRLCRGAGVRGLSGMAERRGIFLRPLLSVPSSDLRHWAEKERLSFRSDPSNLDLNFRRNRLRHRVWPEMERIHGPNLAEVLGRTSETFRVAADYLDREVERTWEALEPQIDTGSIQLDRTALAAYDPAIIEGVLRRSIRHLSGPLRDLGRAPIAAVANSVCEPHPKTFHLPNGLRIFVNANAVRLVVFHNDVLSKQPRLASNLRSDSLRVPTEEPKSSKITVPLDETGFRIDKKNR